MSYFNLQDRINRMNAWKEQQNRADEEFIRKQKIRMFINDCDEIRPELRSHLLKDSKLCQLEQIKEQQQRRLMSHDLNKAWHEVQSRDNQQRNEREVFIAQCRRHEGLSIQEFQKHQMADKIERGLKICEEIDDERKQFEQICKEDLEKEKDRLRNEEQTRKFIGDAVKRQMNENYQRQKQLLENELKRDQTINEQIRKNLERDQSAEKAEREQFRRDVFTYLDHLMMTRHHEQTVEREKEQLLNDIRVKAEEEEFKRRCEAKKKRQLVNQVARIGQVDQIRKIEKSMIDESSKAKEENAAFNEREAGERQKIKEAQWQQRLRAYHYGRELMEQRKAEEIRDLAEKQKLHERLVLAAQEREKAEAMGREFVKSYQDVLPLHPNLLIIQKGKHN